MKRRTVLATVGMGVLGGCADDDSSSDEQVGDTSSTVSGPSGIEFTIQETRLVNTFSTPEGTQRRKEADRFAFVVIEAENTTDTTVTLPRRDEFSLVVDDRQYSAKTPTTVEDFQEEPISEVTNPSFGDIYTTVENARSGVATNGWILFQVPQDTKSGEISWYRQYEMEDPVSTSVSFNPGELANLNLVGIEAPSQVERHSQFRVDVTVENTGGGFGEWEGNLNIDPGDGGGGIAIGVHPGETVTKSYEFDYPIQDWETTTTAKVSINGQSETVEFVTPTRDLGEKYNTPNGLSIAVTDTKVPNEVVIDSMVFGEYTNFEPKEGNYLLLARLSVKNNDGVERIPPQTGSLSIYSDDDDEMDKEVVYPSLGNSDFREPVSEPSFDFDTVDSGESISGWVLFRVDDELDPENGYLRWSQSESFSTDENAVDDLIAQWWLTN